jgi:murein DD-endopeptidase MepM/ murein hydrolase activator NlpD
MQKKNKYYTVMFVPEGNARTFSMHVHKNIVYSLVVFLFIFLVGFVLLVVKSGEIAAKLQLVYILTSENKRLKDENKKMNYVVAKLDRIEQLGHYLQSLARATGADQKKNQNATLGARETPDKVFLRDNMDDMLDSLRKSSTNDSNDVHKAGAVTQLYLASLPNIQPVIDGWITRRYVVETNDTEQAHTGVDYAATQGTLIRATAPGIVEEVFNDRYFGLMLTINHGYGMATRYGHCSQILVSKGDHVERGQTVALVGNTGRSSAPHLHYEVLKDGKNVDPTKYIFGTDDK